MIMDLELAPADDARKEIAMLLTHVDQFIQGRDNGISCASIDDVRNYLKSVVNYKSNVMSMETYKDRYELELELGFVKVACKIKRY